MFRWFEAQLNPFPSEHAARAPQGLVAFCWHYSRDAAPWLIALSVLTALVSVGEVVLFGFLGNVVDWLKIQQLVFRAAAQLLRIQLGGTHH